MDIVDAVKGPVTKIGVDKGFTQNESQLYFASVMDCSVTELPNQAVTIHQTSHGSPMVVALIGGMLREQKHRPRWDYYVRKLEESPRSVLEMTSNRNDYQHESVDEAIRLSVESLKDDLREKFFDFAVFDDGMLYFSPQSMIRKLIVSRTGYLQMFRFPRRSSGRYGDSKKTK